MVIDVGSWISCVGPGKTICRPITKVRSFLLFTIFILGADSDVYFYYENKCRYPVWLAARPSVGDADPERGDCGSGVKECQNPPPALPVTLLNFEIKLLVVSYEVSLNHGHNAPVRIEPDGS
ncbi:uncharacterized protein LOC132191585 [Corylus avellana]|uniref:uncharacterized protein LOC132191585 n=1 Tax=Corylus avellana TaxID=13451 RepID=UPI00286A7388|nr:uncharacterized protein LOC132191585 [Corylus avellana]